MPRNLSLAIAAVAIANALAAGLTVILPDILTGPAVTNGSAFGTALVMLVMVVPLLAVSTWLAIRGSWRGVVIAVGALAYLLYNDVLLVLATPFNRLFLLYEAALSLTLFTLAAAVLSVDVGAIAERARRVPVRAITIYTLVIVILNTLIWLRGAVTATLADDPTSFLVGSGVATNPVYVQDLAFWLPATAMVAWLAWRRRPLGIVLIGAWLVYGLLESIGVATDQWFGTTADPSSPHAGMGAVYLFAVLAVIGLVPLYFYFRPGPREAQPIGRP